MVEKDKNIELIKQMEEADIEEVLRREIKKAGTSAHIFLPKRFIGREAIIVVKKENKK